MRLTAGFLRPETRPREQSAERDLKKFRLSKTTGLCFESRSIWYSLRANYFGLARRTYRPKTLCYSFKMTLRSLRATPLLLCFVTLCVIVGLLAIGMRNYTIYRFPRILDS